MYNKVILIGNLGADPELTTLPGSETKKTTISLATSQKFRNKRTQEMQTETQWHRVVFWNRTAEIAEAYLAKGSLIQIEGLIKYNSWEDKDGQKRYSTEIHAEKLTLLPSKTEGTQPRESAPPQAAQNEQERGQFTNAPFPETDDLPF